MHMIYVRSTSDISVNLNIMLLYVYSHSTRAKNVSEAFSQTRQLYGQLHVRKVVKQSYILSLSFSLQGIIPTNMHSKRFSLSNICAYIFQLVYVLPRSGRFTEHQILKCRAGYFSASRSLHPVRRPVLQARRIRFFDSTLALLQRCNKAPQMLLLCCRCPWNLPSRRPGRDSSGRFRKSL